MATDPHVARVIDRGHEIIRANIECLAENATRLSLARGRMQQTVQRLTRQGLLAALSIYDDVESPRRAGDSSIRVEPTRPANAPGRERLKVEPAV